MFLSTFSILILYGCTPSTEKENDTTEDTTTEDTSREDTASTEDTSDTEEEEEEELRPLPEEGCELPRTLGRKGQRQISQGL